MHHLIRYTHPAFRTIFPCSLILKGWITIHQASIIHNRYHLPIIDSHTKQTLLFRIKELKPMPFSTL